MCGGGIIGVADVSARVAEQAYEYGPSPRCTVPAYQEVRVNLNGQVRLTSNHCLFILSRTDLAKNGVTVKAGFQGVTSGSLYVILQNSSGHDRKIEKNGSVCHRLTVHNSLWASQFQLKNGTFTEIQQEQPARPVWSAA